MKKTPRLRNYISVSLAVIILVMIIAYSLLVQYALKVVLLDAATYELKLTARDYTLEYEQDSDAPLPQTKYLKSYLFEKDLPAWFKERHDPKTLEYGKLTYGEIIDDDTIFYISIRNKLHNNNDLYLIQTYAESDEVPGSFANWDRAQYLTLALGIGFILLVGIALIIFIHQISKPISSLTAWANNLDESTVDAPHPNFQFDEINQIADFIQNASNNLQQALAREHHFLRNASHELRTPIAIIRSNIDLLDKIRANADSKEMASYQRIRRAADNMQHLTETLLWLSRKKETMPDPEPIDVESMLHEIIEENQYLLVGKKIKLKLNALPLQVTLPKTAIRIILSNLIRNAFQHTISGHIEIQLTKNLFTIKNVNKPEYAPQHSSDYGFGLGLMLIEQIWENLELDCHNQMIPGGHLATLNFPILNKNR